MTDEEIVLLLNKGSVGAFNMAYNRYVKRIYAYCLPYLKSRELTEEVVQDVFVNIWRYRTKIDPQRSFSTLIYNVARRLCINAMRSIVNGPIYEDYLLYRNNLIQTDSSSLEYSELRRRVMTLASRLPRTQRRVFMLSRVKNRGNQEIATELHISEKTVSNQLSLALKSLRQSLSLQAADSKIIVFAIFFISLTLL